MAFVGKAWAQKPDIPVIAFGGYASERIQRLFSPPCPRRRAYSETLNTLSNFAPVAGAAMAGQPLFVGIACPGKCPHIRLHQEIAYIGLAANSLARVCFLVLPPRAAQWRLWCR